jgi:thiol-disulfide isomerase/thioredoxin
MRFTRRSLTRGLATAAAGTLAAAVLPRKPRAEDLPPPTGMTRFDPPKPAPDAAFVTADGTQHLLSDFKGRGMVVNLWATWCGPCVAEMPSLAILSKALAPSDIAVLPLSSDRGGAPVVSAWFARHDVTTLPVLLDPHGNMARALGTHGIPTTVIINTANQMVAQLVGAADWSSPAVQAMVKKLVSA